MLKNWSKKIKNYILLQPVEQVRKGGVDVVITGQLFYEDPIKLDMNGTMLTGEVKSLSPETIVLRYSISPSFKTNLNGDIRKDGDASVLVDLVNAEELGPLVRSRNFSGLEKKFPDIKWYSPK